MIGLVAFPENDGHESGVSRCTLEAFHLKAVSVYIGKRDIVPVRECQDFLVAVVNELPSMKAKYWEGKWFPLFEDRYRSEYEALLALAYEALKGYHWKNSELPLGPPPKDLTRFYAMIFTHKLRLVWHRALGLGSSGEDPQAAVMRLILDTRSFQQIRREVGVSIPPSATPWCYRPLDALTWLYRNTDKLRRCGVAECKIHPYFIVSPAHKTYCSTPCKELSEMARGAERAKEQAARRVTTKENRISPEGLKNISEAQKLKWAKRRKAAKKGVE